MSALQQKRRVVMTGIGLVSPVGVGTDTTWRAIRASESGIAPITLFDASRHSTRFAGEVKNFDPLQWLDKKEITDRMRAMRATLDAQLKSDRDATWAWHQKVRDALDTRTDAAVEL
ncbi:MAG: beta-ketoacyl synthase N-terminal-like domain-containing protein, partial [Vicinamibacterales bacterium]